MPRIPEPAGSASFEAADFLGGHGESLLTPKAFHVPVQRSRNTPWGRLRPLHLDALRENVRSLGDVVRRLANSLHSAIVTRLSEP